VNYNDINTKTEKHNEFTRQLKLAAAKISTILHFSGELDPSTAKYREINEKANPIIT
jgi:hypothetical protein